MTHTASQTDRPGPASALGSARPPSVPSAIAGSPSIAPRDGARVLVVEDDADLARLYRAVLATASFEVDWAAEGQAAIEMFRAAPYDLVITDLTMPQMDGMELLRAIRRLDLDVPVVIVTAAPAVDSAMRALEYGALRYLAKPVQNAQLLQVAREAVTLHELARLKRRALALMQNAAAGQSDRARQEAQFERALGSLFLSYQPIVSLSKREVLGYEALVRSREPQLGAPALLFEAARRFNRFRELGRRIRELAPRRFVGGSDLLFINVDASDLEDDSLYDRDSPLARMAERVVVELTERVSLDSIKSAYERVAELRAIGFRIAIDDLGAGYAGLSYFGAIEPDVCKLDMTLVRGVDASPTKQKIVASMLRMCRELGITLVCEGVETAAERDALLALGCDALQGFLFARPSSTFPSVSW